MKVAFVVKTNKLEYDDRVRKQALWVSGFAEVKIFVLDDGNAAVDGVTDYGVPFRSVHLKTRALFPQAKFLWLKTLEFFFSVKSDLNKYDVVWVHDVAPFLFLFSRRCGRLFVWDLHEVPEFFLASKFRLLVFRHLVGKCSIVLHANEERISFLAESGAIVDPDKHLAVRNFPDSELLGSLEENPKFKEFVSWLNGSECIYLQGLNSRKRYPYETVKAVLENGAFKAVVIGTFHDQDKQRLVQEFGERLNDFVFFAGQIRQMEIPKYLESCKFTMVFYTTDTPNNRFCEPNRLFQAIACGKPAVVGQNESMKRFAERLKVGVVAKSDGRNVESIVDAIHELATSFKCYRVRAEEAANMVLWESQSVVFEEIKAKLSKVV